MKLILYTVVVAGGLMVSSHGQVDEASVTEDVVVGLEAEAGQEAETGQEQEVSGQKDAVKPHPFKWEPLKIAKSHFPRSIAMMDTEREDYAKNLAGVAIQHLIANDADEGSQELSRQMMALALHLSPRNKRALVLNIKLAKGEIPQAPNTDYRPATLARLLMKRAELLEEQKDGKGNIELAGYFYSLAAGLVPDSEDAIYYNELHRINHGEADWARLQLNKE